MTANLWSNDDPANVDPALNNKSFVGCIKTEGGYTLPDGLLEKDGSDSVDFLLNGFDELQPTQS